MKKISYNQKESIIFKLVTGVILFCACSQLTAQVINQPESVIYQNKISYQPKRVTGKSFIIPTVLVTTGALGISGEFVISNPEIKEEHDEHFATFHTNVDDYLQYAPIIAGYAMLINNPQHSSGNTLKRLCWQK